MKRLIPTLPLSFTTIVKQHAHGLGISPGPVLTAMIEANVQTIANLNPDTDDDDCERFNTPSVPTAVFDALSPNVEGRIRAWLRLLPQDKLQCLIEHHAATVPVKGLYDDAAVLEAYGQYQTETDRSVGEIAQDWSTSRQTLYTHFKRLGLSIDRATNTDKVDKQAEAKARKQLEKDRFKQETVNAFVAIQGGHKNAEQVATELGYQNVSSIYGRFLRAGLKLSERS
jgi:predicted DNA-binding protein YlxM (UPF0122 family)